MDEENTAYLTVNGNAANPYISLTAVGATFATRSELKVEANNITFNGNKVWHSGNDGSGSTLDADLLDGKQASAFALSAHTHNYAPISYFDNTGSYQGLVGTNGYIRTPVNGIIQK